MVQLERRNHERIETDLPTRLWLREEYRGKEIEFEGFAVVCDLAIGGAFVRSDYLLPVGFPLNLDLELDDGELLVCRGEIAHCISLGESYEPGMGIMFTNADAENRERLLRFFISDRIQQFYDDRFMEEFPHLQPRLSLSDIALVLNLWEDKQNRLATLHREVSDAERTQRREEEIAATQERARLRRHPE